jgi:hypothetical protein
MDLRRFLEGFHFVDRELSLGMAPTGSFPTAFLGQSIEEVCFCGDLFPDLGQKRAGAILEPENHAMAQGNELIEQVGNGLIR